VKSESKRGSPSKEIIKKITMEDEKEII